MGEEPPPRLTAICCRQSLKCRPCPIKAKEENPRAKKQSKDGR